VSLDTLEKSHRNISHAKAATALGYAPRPFEETLADTIAWFREHKYI
jgi:dihydroflavonol-4-reductase